MGRHDQMVLEIGEDVEGYRVESFVARGGMAVVYKARDRRLGRPVALKLIAPELAADPTFRARFTRESELAASLDHPNVLPIYQAGEIDGMLWTAMRFVDGEDLDAVLGRRGQLTPDETITIFTAVAAALDAAHARELVHRDVKPGNILLTGQDDANGMNLAARHIYLTDFGLTKRSADVTGLTTAGQFLGTIAYVAPEQIASQAVDHRADVYSLGCVLYHVLSGAAPFARDDYVAMLWAHITSPPPLLSAVASDVPAAVDTVLQSAMAKEPIARPDSCGALVGQLREAFGLAAQVPFRLADRPGRIAGVRDRFAGEPADDRPTEVAPQPSATATPAGPAPAAAASALSPPAPAEPAAPASSPPGGRVSSADAPADAGDSAAPSLEQALVSGPAPVEPPVPPRRADATAVSDPAARAQAIAERDSPPTLVSHRRDPDPPTSAARIGRLALVAGVVALVVLAVSSGFWLFGPDGTDQARTATPSQAPPTSASPSPTTPASVAKPLVLTTVKVGNGPQGIAFSRDNRWVYIANSNERSVSVIDNEDHRAVKRIATPDQPQYLAASPTRDLLYVSTHNDDGSGNAVVVIDTAKSTVVKRIPVEQATDSHPYALAVSPDGGLLYVPDHDREVVLVIDASTNQLVMRLGVEPRPHWVAFGPSGSKVAYIVDHESNKLTVVNTTTTAKVATIAVGNAPHSVAVTPDGTRAFTANYDDGSTSLVDLKLRKRLRDAPVGANPRCVAVSADGKHAYFAVTGDDTLTVLDTTTLQRTASIKLGVDPYVVAVSLDGRTGYVTNRESDTVTVLSLTA